MGFTEKWINNFFFHAQSQKVKIDVEKKRAWTVQYYRLYVVRAKSGFREGRHSNILGWEKGSNGSIPTYISQCMRCTENEKDKGL